MLTSPLCHSDIILDQITVELLFNLLDLLHKYDVDAVSLNSVVSVDPACPHRATIYNLPQPSVMLVQCVSS